MFDLDGGGFFGDSILSNEVNRSSSAKAVSEVDLFKLSKRDLDAVLQSFPNEKEALSGESRSRGNTLKNIRDKARSRVDLVYQNMRRSGSRTLDQLADEARKGMHPFLCCFSI